MDACITEGISGKVARIYAKNSDKKTRTHD